MTRPTLILLLTLLAGARFSGEFSLQAQPKSLHEIPLFEVSDPLNPIHIPQPRWRLIEGETELDIEAILAGNWADASQDTLTDESFVLPGAPQWVPMRISSHVNLDNWLLYIQDETHERGFLFGYDDLEIYFIDQNGTVTKARAGTQVPRSQRTHQADPTLNLVPISLSENEPLQVWIRFRHQRIHKIFPTLSLRNPALNYPQYNNQVSMIYAGEIAVFVLLFFMAILLRRFTGDSIYGTFSLYTGMLTLYIISFLPQLNIQEIFWSEWPFITINFALITGVLSWYYLYKFGASLIPPGAPEEAWIKKGRGWLWMTIWVNVILIPIGNGTLWWGPIPELSVFLFGLTILGFIAISVISVILLRYDSLITKLVGLSFLIIFGCNVLLNLINYLGFIDPRIPVNLPALIPIGPTLLGVFALLYRFRESEATKREAARLAELDRAKTRLYTNITHEFRTPLTVIQGMSDQIAKAPETWLEKGTTMIRRNSRRVLQLVNQMLDLARLESGQLSLNLQQADVVPYLRYLAESFQSYAESRDIDLQTQTTVDHCQMDMDPERLAQVCSNLLSNAIKFTPAGGKVRFQVEVQGLKLIIRVSDTGHGIPQDLVRHIFDRFFQVEDDSNRRADGTGIGLALTRDLVELMKGQISVESELKRGSMFTVSLPITQQTAPRPIPQLAPKPAETELHHAQVEWPAAAVPDEVPHILVIEDNADVLSYLLSCLEGRYQVEIARDGAEGISKALEWVPDLIISDIMMPHKDGFEVCHSLKNDVRTSHIPILLLTAKADAKAKLTGLRKGADAYLTKPFDETELHLRLQNMLTLRDAQQRYFIGESEHPPTKAPDPEEAFLARFRAVVMASLADPNLDVAALCTALGMSRTPLHHKIKALTGMSTTEFVRHIRLNEAHRMLAETDLLVAEVAYKIGFQSPGYFSRKYKEMFGQSPSKATAPLGLPTDT